MYKHSKIRSSNLSVKIRGRTDSVGVMNATLDEAVKIEKQLSVDLYTIAASGEDGREGRCWVIGWREVHSQWHLHHSLAQYAALFPSHYSFVSVRMPGDAAYATRTIEPPRFLQRMRRSGD